MVVSPWWLVRGDDDGDDQEDDVGSHDVCDDGDDGVGDGILSLVGELGDTSNASWVAILMST